MVSKPGDLWGLPAAEANLTEVVNKLGAEERKTRGGAIVVFGEEELSCDVVEPPVRSMAHFDLTGSPSQGGRDSWLSKGMLVWYLGVSVYTRLFARQPSPHRVKASLKRCKALLCPSGSREKGSCGKALCSYTNIPDHWEASGRPGSLRSCMADSSKQ